MPYFAIIGHHYAAAVESGNLIRSVFEAMTDKEQAVFRMKEYGLFNGEYLRFYPFLEGEEM